MRKGLDKKYEKLRKEFLSTHTCCQARLPGCSLTATDCHHKMGRGAHYLDSNEFLALCRHCHCWVTDHPAEAVLLGFSKLRLNNQQDE